MTLVDWGESKWTAYDATFFWGGGKLGRPTVYDLKSVGGRVVIH